MSDFSITFLIHIYIMFSSYMSRIKVPLTICPITTDPFPPAPPVHEFEYVPGLIHDVFEELYPVHSSRQKIFIEPEPELPPGIREAPAPEPVPLLINVPFSPYYNGFTM